MQKPNPKRNNKKFFAKLLKEDSAYSEELPSLHDRVKESLTDFKVNGSWDEIDPIVYDTPIF